MDTSYITVRYIEIGDLETKLKLSWYEMKIPQWCKFWPRDLIEVLNLVISSDYNHYTKNVFLIQLFYIVLTHIFDETLEGAEHISNISDFFWYTFFNIIFPYQWQWWNTGRRRRYKMCILSPVINFRLFECDFKRKYVLSFGFCQRVTRHT